MRTWFRRVWHLLNRSRRERELVLEMNDHRAAMTAPATFGDPHRLLEQSRDAWGWNWLDDALQDLRFAMRGLMRSPVFSVTSVLILSFGIGLNLTVFQMANVVLLRPPSLSSPDTLARLHRHGKAIRANSEAVPYVYAQAVARNATSLRAIFVEANAPVVWGDATGADASFVSPNWFRELEQAAVHGRAFSPLIDASPDAPPVAVVGSGFWKRALGQDAGIVGTSQRINGRPVTIVGIMPDTTLELDLEQSEVFLLITQRDYYFPNSSFLTSWDSNNVSMYARLQSGVSAATVRENLRRALEAVHQEQPDHVDADEWLEPALATTNFTEHDERLAFIGVASTIGLLSTMVLIVAAANLGNLVLSRVSGRSRELGVRIALGARRSRIVRQLAIETLPIGVAGTIGGLLFAKWATSLIATFVGLPRYLNFTPDVTAIIVGAGCMMLALAVVGALPAWKVSKQDLTDAIKDGGQLVSMRLDRARVRAVMLAAQVGGSCLVLIVSAMMARSLQNALATNPGFEFKDAAVVQAGFAAAGVNGEAARRYWTEFRDRIAGSPEVSETALSVNAPFSARGSMMTDAPGLIVVTNRVEPAFFDLMGIAFIAGRPFDDRDDASSTVVISRRLAHQIYGTTDVLGARFPKADPHDTIVGVTADAGTVRPGSSSSAELYRPMTIDDYDKAVLLVKARQDPARLVPILREAGSNGSRVFTATRLLQDDFERRVSGTRIASSIGASIGLLTLLLASIGIFGVVSYGVTLRTKELGIHLALGASRRAIVLIATRQASRPLVIGMSVGTLASVPIAFALSKSPLQLPFTDPVSYLAALAILVVTALAAAVTPVLRALNADPIRALRHQ